MIPDLNLADCSLKDAVHRVDALIREGGHHYVCFCEANLFTSAMRSAEVRAVLDGADMVLADGVSVMLLARLLGHHVPKRVPGPTLLPEVCAYGQTRGYRHFFYGGKPGVAKELSERMQARFPDIRIAGVYSPPFNARGEDDEEKVRRLIEDAHADVLWVGLGSPKQECWIANHVGRLAVPVMLAVGAAFDFHSGHRRWAPLWIRKLGMEWAFRMFTGGWTVFKRNLRCVLLMAMALVIVLVRRVLTGRKA